MKLEKFLWSKTKVDILKYLIFKRQWISIRALENELERSFPAIKKQVDLLFDADVIDIDKTNNKWSISIRTDILDVIKNIFIFNLELEFVRLFTQYDTMLETYYLGKIFWRKIDYDIVILHKNIQKEFLEKIQEDIEIIFRDYFLDHVWVVFMSNDDFQRRYRLADKFVLNLITNSKQWT